MKVEQPSIEAQQELNSIVENLPDLVKIRNRKYKIKWMHPITIRKITQINQRKGNDHNASYKVAACIILNNIFKLWFIYPFLWRWFYYIKKYTEDDLTEVLATGKKKIPFQQYYVNTILMTDMTDMMMAMTKDEVSSIRQEQSTAQRGSSQKNTAG